MGRRSLTAAGKPSIAALGIRGHKIKNRERTEDRYREIILGGARVFARKGYTASTMDDIAAELGGTKGTLYYYFHSKEEIYAAIRITATEDAIVRVQQIVDREEAPEVELRRIVKDLVVHGFEGLGRFTPVLDERYALGPENRRRIRTLQRQYESLVIRTVQRGIEQGLFADRDPKVMAFTMLHTARSPRFWYSEKGAVKREDVIRQVTEQALSGLMRL